MVNQKFGITKVIAFKKIKVGKRNRTMCECKCACGQIHYAEKHSIKTGRIKSCGCKKKKINGMFGSREYNTWKGMIDRCERPSCASFYNYGQKGITVSKRWHDFKLFFKDMGRRPQGHSLDRIDNTKGYFKKNCRWASSKDQAANRRCSQNYFYKNKSLTTDDVQKITGLSQGQIWYRRNVKKMTDAEILNSKPREKFTYGGRLLNKTQIAKKIGVNKQTFMSASQRMGVYSAIDYFKQKLS
jgi:hypothetical protein